MLVAALYLVYIRTHFFSTVFSLEVPFSRALRNLLLLYSCRLFPGRSFSGKF